MSRLQEAILLLERIQRNPENVAHNTLLRNDLARFLANQATPCAAGLDAPLPCDVQVGHATFRKGVRLGTFVAAARRWHREAYPEGYTLTDEQKAANLAALQGACGVDPSVKELSNG